MSLQLVDKKRLLLLSFLLVPRFSIFTRMLNMKDLYRLEIFMVLKIHVAFFWVVTPCSVVGN